MPTTLSTLTEPAAQMALMAACPITTILCTISRQPQRTVLVVLQASAARLVISMIRPTTTDSFSFPIDWKSAPTVELMFASGV